MTTVIEVPEFKPKTDCDQLSRKILEITQYPPTAENDELKIWEGRNSALFHTSKSVKREDSQTFFFTAKMKKGAEFEIITTTNEHITRSSFLSKNKKATENDLLKILKNIRRGLYNAKLDIMKEGIDDNIVIQTRKQNKYDKSFISNSDYQRKLLETQS